MGFLADLLIRIGADADDVKKALSDSRRDMQSWARDMQSLGATLTAAITVPLAGVGIAALKVAGELEQNSIAFKTMLGSTEAAQQHLTALRDFALKTPFEFNDLVTASKRMQALGFSAKDVIPNLTAIGDAAAALGLGAEGIQRITLALGQMKAKGTIQAEEMRQLAEAGIPAWQILAKTLNTTVADAMKQVEKRAVDSATAVPALLAGINSKFGGLMAAQSQTLLGQFSNLKDQITFTLQDIGKTLAPIFSNIMENVIKPGLEMVKDLAAKFAALPPGIQQTAIAFAGLAAALGPLGLVAGVSLRVFSDLAGLLTALPTILSPVNLAIVALGATAVIAISQLERSTAELRSLGHQFEEYIAGLVKMEGNFEYAHKKLDKALDDGLITLAQYNQALAILEDREKKAVGSGLSKQFEDMGVKLKVVTEAANSAGKSFSLLASVYVEQLVAASGKAKDTLNKYFNLLQTGYKETVKLWDPTPVEKFSIQIQTALGPSTFEGFARGATSAEAFSLNLKQQMLDDADAIEAMKVALDVFNGIARATGPVIAQIAEVDFDKTRIGLLKTDAIMAQMGLTSTHALREMYEGELKNAIALETLREAGQATGGDVAAAAARVAEAWKALSEQIGNGTNAAYKKAKTGADEFQKIASAAARSISSSIADVILRTKSLSDAFRDVGKAIIRMVVEDAIENGLKKLVKYIVDDVLPHLGAVGKALGGILGGGGSAAGTAASTAGSAGSSAGGGAASAAGGAASGLAGVVTAVSGVVTAVSSVVGNFQMAGMNKSLDVLVNHTLVIANELTNLRKDEWDRFGQIFTRMGETWQACLDIRDAIRGPMTNSKQAVQITINLDGKAIWSGMSNAAMLAGVN